MQLTLSTLGTLQASTTDAQGTTRTLSRGKPVAMLAYLACIPGHKASREHLSALLWGDVDSDAARQNLRQTVWYLKKKLGDGLLEVSGEVLGLAATFTCDRDEFLAAAHHADFVGAVQRHAGPFIPDFAAPGASEFEQWCELERRRVTVTFLRCADALARQWLSEGKFRDAQELARRARDVDPMDQATWRLLLEALIAGSDGLGAASEAEHFEAFLAREEQEPDSASVAVMRAARRSPVAPAPDATGYASSIAAELVGREAEFSHVLSAWEQARNGTPRVILVAAAAGLGKSRLLRDVRARLRGSRSRCILVRANPGDRHLTDGFLAEVASQLATLSGAAAVSTGSAGVLVALAPALASLYASATPDNSEGEEAVRRRALAMVDLIHAVSEEHAVALLLDDLHWADDHSARVIAAALSRLEHARLMVVMTKRPVPDPRALFSTFERLELPPLDLAAVHAFVSHAAELPSAPWADILPQQLLLATGGSPLLLVETLHDALEQGWLSCSAVGVWQCPDPSRVTASLREGSAVRQRVLRLSPPARQALLVLAVVGRPIEVDDLSAMVGAEPRVLEEQLELLERGGFLTRNATQLVVAHDEIADAVIAASLEDQRRTAHASIARTLLSRADDEYALRRAAEHAVAAGEDTLLAMAWRRFLGLRRRARDRRATRSIAVDFLGLDAASPKVQQLVAATPLWKRKRARWLTAAAAVLVTASASVATLARRPAPPLTSDFTFLTVDSATGEHRYVGVRIRPDEPWEAGVPLEATELDSTAYPKRPPGANALLQRGPDGKRWWTMVTGRENGDEVVWIDSLGRMQFPMPSAGDDVVESVSPDGRLLLASTGRFDTITDHLQQVIVDPERRTVRRLTNSTEGDREGRWRPDGTQIAFRRHHFSVVSSDSLCLVDFDGGNERCLPTEVSDRWGLIGWLDEDRLLVNASDGRVFGVDARSGEARQLTEMRGAYSTFNGSLLLCRCGTAADANRLFYLAPTSNPAAARPVLYEGRPLVGYGIVAAPRYPERQWLATLRLVLPTGGLSVEHAHQLRADGRRANGAPAPLHDLRWTSRDTTVATVDSLGRFRPRRLGATWIVVSAGGWRVDSALARVTPATSHTLVREFWDTSWVTRWRAFGEPRPRLVETAIGPAFLPNGDGSYPSGAYLPLVIPSVSGAGVEAVVSMPITRSQWQTLSVSLMPARALQGLRRWDHVTGDAVMPDGYVCWAVFPGGEGGRAIETAAYGGRQNDETYFVPPGLYNGRWHRVRLQLLPDGRCALAIDGRPIGARRGRTPPPASGVFVHVIGNSRFNGRLVVGPLEAWTGVRGGVDWTLVDDDSMTRKP
ncbi:MAG: AAA family ATPase [Gemmatimonadetes bacterium]|nr:AAA family ATPase [Gemmatimonadota bacterium]